MYLSTNRQHSTTVLNDTNLELIYIRYFQINNNTTIVPVRRSSLSREYRGEFYLYVSCACEAVALKTFKD